VKKYEFTGATVEFFGHTLRQIRRLSDGELGGWIQGEHNLSHYGACWAHSYARVCGDARVSDDAKVHSGAIFRGSISGGTFRRVAIHGGEFYGGVYTNGVYHGGSYFDDAYGAPLQIQGSVNFVNISGRKLVIGCEVHTIEHWLECYEIIGAGHGYTNGEIEEYRRYIELAAVMMGVRT
jgi:hypothetical protein